MNVIVQVVAEHFVQRLLSLKLMKGGLTMGHFEPVEILCPLLNLLPFQVLKSNLNET
jgi:hypothetical protein